MRTDHVVSCRIVIALSDRSWSDTIEHGTVARPLHIVGGRTTSREKVSGGMNADRFSRASYVLPAVMGWALLDLQKVATGRARIAEVVLGWGLITFSVFQAVRVVRRWKKQKAAFRARTP
jgi:hypothetical protein